MHMVESGLNSKESDSSFDMRPLMYEAKDTALEVSINPDFQKTSLVLNEESISTYGLTRKTEFMGYKTKREIADAEQIIINSNADKT